MDFEFDHAAISVSDLANSIGWYSRLFGFELIQTFERPDLGAKGAFLRLGNAYLEMFEFRDCETVPSYRRALSTDLRVNGTKYFALRVRDVEHSTADLGKQGVEFVMTPEVGGSGFKYVFLKDPDGILIELIETTPAEGR